MRGGLAQVNIIGSVIFSGMSGTALADAAGIGTIEIKAMKDHGYTTEFAVGVTAASATLGPIIPPSLPFVIYGMMANVSIGALFLAGIIPGVVMTLLMMATVAFFAHATAGAPTRRSRGSSSARRALEVVIVLGFPLLSGLIMGRPVGSTLALGIALAVLLALDWYFDFSAVMALMTPVILIGGMTTGLVHPDRGRRRGRDLVAVPGPGPLPLDDLAHAGQGDLRHHRDDGLGPVHRHRGLDLRVAADRRPGGADSVRPRSSA